MPSAQHRVRVHFTALLLPGAHCATHYVAVWAPAEPQRRLATVCGDRLPAGELLFAGPEVVVEFVSGALVPPFDYNGFAATVAFVGAGGGGSEQVATRAPRPSAEERQRQRQTTTTTTTVSPARRGGWQPLAATHRTPWQAYEEQQLQQQRLAHADIGKKPKGIDRNVLDVVWFIIMFINFSFPRPFRTLGPVDWTLQPPKYSPCDKIIVEANGRSGHFDTRGRPFAANCRLIFRGRPTDVVLVSLFNYRLRAPACRSVIEIIDGAPEMAMSGELGGVGGVRTACDSKTVLGRFKRGLTII